MQIPAAVAAAHTVQQRRCQQGLQHGLCRQSCFNPCWSPAKLAGTHGCAAAVIDQASRRTLFTLYVPQRTAAYRVLRPTWWHQSSLVCCRAHASLMLDNAWRLRGILAQWDCAACSPLYCVKLMGHALIVPCDVAATCSLLSLHVWIVHHHGAWMIHATSCWDLG